MLDLTDQDLVNLRRTLYLTIMSSVSFEECAHKITRLKIPDGYELELCNMLGASLAVHVYMHTYACFKNVCADTVHAVYNVKEMHAQNS